MIPHDRLRHCIGVAEYMYKNAKKYDIEPEKAYIIGLLHDIGYIYKKEDHEKTGADLLAKYFGPSDISELILHHGDNPESVGTPSKELILLWEADMSVDLSGENVGFVKRLADIRRRHGTDSVAYQISQNIVNYLIHREV